jgi:hypothetical protein
MKDYLRWSLYQLYLAFFWPTRFHREVDGIGSRRRLAYRERLWYTGGMGSGTSSIGGTKGTRTDFHAHLKRSASPGMWF